MKLVDSLHYHLWTDALHARALARQTTDEWDRGSYVRWSVHSAWTTFESVCGEALGADHLGNRYRENLDKAIAAKGLQALDWSQGLWQRVFVVYGRRKDYTHIRSKVDQARLFAPLAEAEEAIATLRRAILDIYARVSTPAPPWTADDEDPGWKGRGGLTDSAHATIIRGGSQDDPSQAIKITYVFKGTEHVSEVTLPGTPHLPLMDELIRNINIPVEAVRAYRGETLLDEKRPLFRGSSNRPS